MILLDHRQKLVRDIDQAHREGARLRPACEVAGIDVRTLQRWRSTGLAVQADQRKHCQRPTPVHALTQKSARKSCVWPMNRDLRICGYAAITHRAHACQ